MDTLIRAAEPQDFPAILDIYNHWIRASHVTFDTEPFSPEERDPWFRQFDTMGPYRLFTAERGGQIVGYASSKEFRFKPAYSTSVETTVYLEPASLGHGVGRPLYAALLTALEGEARVHRAFAGIALPNAASIALHEKLGFELVGTFREVGRKFGRFWDVSWYGRDVSTTM